MTPVDVTGCREIRRTVAAAAVAAAAFPGAGVAAGQPSCPHSGQFTETGAWTRIRGPRYAEGEGPAAVRAFAATADAGVLYATNGSTVRASVDSGCTWDPVFAIGPVVEPLAGTAGGEATVVTHVAAGPRRGHDVWLAGQETADEVTRPRVWFSHDARPDQGGPRAAFSGREEGLPPAGVPLAFAVGSGGDRPGAAYLLLRVPVSVDLPPREETALYRFDGSRWVGVALPARFAAAAALAADPSGRVIVWTGSAYAVHDGRAWAAYGASGRIRVVATNGITSRTPSVFYDGARGGGVAWRDVRWRPTTQPAPAGVTAAAGTAAPQLAAVSARDGVYGFDRRLHRWIDVTPAPGVRLADLHLAAARRTPVLLGRTDRDLYRLDLYDGGLFRPGPAPRSLREVVPRDPVPGPAGARDALTPARTEVTLRPGERADVPLELTVAARPTPLDVYFLVDTTSSMFGHIEGLRTGMRDVIRTLDATGVDAAFGVGDVKDYDAVDPLDRDMPQTYRRWVRITRDRAAVHAALAQLRAGGGGSRPEAQTVALHHLADPRGDLPRVEPDQDAEFRPGALKVVMLLSDASFHQDERQGYFTIDSVVRDLVADGIRVVGIVARTGVAGDPGDPRADQEQVAAGTGAVAPARGVDCDGDGSVDIGAGAPLVCDVDRASAGNLAPVVLGLLDGRRDPGRVAISLGGALEAVVSPTGTEAVVDLVRPQRIRHTVTVTCPDLDTARDLVVTATGSVRGEAAGTARIVVHCRPEPRPFVLDRDLDRVAAPVPPPPQAPSGPHTLDVNANPNPQVNAQFGAATDPEENPQVELAVETVRDEAPQAAAPSYAASAPREDSAAALALGAAGVTAAATAVAYARQRGTAPALQRARSRRSRNSSTLQ